MTRTNASTFPTWLWGECLRYVVYVYNRTPHSALKYKSPFEARFGTSPDLSGIHKFGQWCIVRLEAPDKLGTHGRFVQWLGPDESSLGHRVYWPKERRISVE